MSDEGSKEGRRDRTREEKGVARSESRGRWIFFTGMPLRFDGSGRGNWGIWGSGCFVGLELGDLRLGLAGGEFLGLGFGGGEAGWGRGGVAETCEPSDSESESIIIMKRRALAKAWRREIRRRSAVAAVVGRV